MLHCILYRPKNLILQPLESQFTEEIPESATVKEDSFPAPHDWTEGQLAASRDNSPEREAATGASLPVRDHCDRDTAAATASGSCDSARPRLQRLLLGAAWPRPQRSFALRRRACRLHRSEQRDARANPGPCADRVRACRECRCSLSGK